MEAVTGKKTGKRRWLRAAAILAGVLCALALAGVLIVRHDWSGAPPISTASCANPHIAADGICRISAHRSGGGIAPENTLMAFRNCVEGQAFSVDIFEFDLHITKDGELVLLHDDTLDRTSDAVEVFGCENVLPAEHTYEELRQLNMGESFTASDGTTPYRGLRGEDVPEELRILRLEDAFAFLREYGDYDFVIEIKDSGENGRKACDRLSQILEDYGLTQRAVVGTFHADITEYLDAAHPELLRSASMKEVALLYGASLLGIDVPKETFAFDALQIPCTYYGIRLDTTRLINYAHARDIAVQFWTINDPDTVSELAAKGADCVMTDYPDMAYAALYGTNGEGQGAEKAA